MNYYITCKINDLISKNLHNFTRLENLLKCFLTKEYKRQLQNVNSYNQINNILQVNC